jgi:hypothetical protein
MQSIDVETQYVYVLSCVAYLSVSGYCMCVCIVPFISEYFVILCGIQKHIH